MRGPSVFARTFAFDRLHPAGPIKALVTFSTTNRLQEKQAKRDVEKTRTRGMDAGAAAIRTGPGQSQQNDGPPLKC